MLWRLTAYGRKLIALCALVFLAHATPQAAFADASGGGQDALVLQLDQASIIKMPDRTSSIVIGNPLVADASVQAGGLMVLTGKGYGKTNLIALDRSGNKLLEKELLVKGPPEMLVVYRGIQRETYSCAPKCEPRNVIGDAQPFFTTTLNQTVTRSTQAGSIK